MRKRVSMRNIIAIAVLSLLGLILTIFSFNIPTTTNTFNGFARSLPVGRELSGGVVAYYDVSHSSNFAGNADKSISNLISDVNNFLYATHHDFIVSKTETGIRVETANTDNLGLVLEYLDGAGAFKIKAEDNEVEDNDLTVLPNHIKNAEFLLNGSQPGVLVVFTSEGSEVFSNLTMSKIGNSIFFMFGEDAVERQISSMQSDGYTFIPFATEAEAKAYAFKANIGLTDINLNVTEILSYKPVLGEGTTTYFAILGLIILVATFILLPVVYKQLGLLANIVVAFFTSLVFLFLSILPNVQLTMATIIGILGAYLIMLGMIILIINKFKKEVELGKKIPVAFKFSFNSSMLNVLDVLSPLFLGSLIVAWIGGSVLRGVMIPIAAGAVLTALLTLVVFKYLIKQYLNINSTKHSKMGFKKIEVLNEEK